MLFSTPASQCRAASSYPWSNMWVRIVALHFIVHGILIHAIAFGMLRDDGRQTVSRYGPRRPELEALQVESHLGKDTGTVVARDYEHKIDWKGSMRSSRGPSGQKVAVVVVVVVVDARWAWCRMRWFGVGGVKTTGLWLVGLCLACGLLLSDALRIVKIERGRQLREGSRKKTR